MTVLNGRLVQEVSRRLGLPPGTGELIEQGARKKLLLSLIGSIALAALEVAGVLAIVPLMQFVAGMDQSSGALGVINRALGNPSSTVLLIAIAGLIVTTFIVKDVIAVWFRRWQVHFMADQEADMSTRLLRGYLRGPYHWHSSRSTGDKVFTVEGAVGIGFFAGLAGAMNAITEIVTIVWIVVGLLVVSWPTTVACLALFGIGSILIQRLIRPRILRASAQATEAAMATSRASLEALGTFKEIKLRHAEDHFTRAYERARRQGAHLRATASLWSELPKYLLEVMFVCAIGLIAILLASTRDPRELLVVLGVFVAAGTRVLPSAVRLMAAISGIKAAHAPLAHLIVEYRLMRDADLEQETEVVSSEVPSGDIHFEEVSFAYRDASDVDILDRVTLTIPRGRSIAVVGSSGAGKSTLIDVLLGMQKPTHGSVTAGGMNIRDNLPGWHSTLAVVPQEVALMNDTLAGNICFDLPRDPDRLADALDRAQLTDLVASLPAGLDTVVGERGARLSGGQRQRIGIARALYRHPKILVLDEATSALDNETERRLAQTIDALKGSMTIVIVAHRLSTVRNTDELLFMSQGKVAARGTFDEVAAMNEEFANLVRLGSLTAR
ncbi:ABC transporter ATP-binding protein [Janibacter sp. GXQ6167]|uniref:ABC transporter ATP-binding protein n=1 Tax=Janibacter sp. GXQ6167 TaxID=3240791 RepID=UPI0035256CA6